jgi:hypothetical protein
MRLVETMTGRIADLDANGGAVKCSICREWFWRGHFRQGSYCVACSNDYQRWRGRLITQERRSMGRVMMDVSVPAFRDLYRSGMIEEDGFTMWTFRWRPGVNDHELPPGAIV